MHGLPLNLNGIRLKTTFPGDTGRNPYNVCDLRTLVPYRLPPPSPARFHLTRFPRPTALGIPLRAWTFFVHRFSAGGSRTISFPPVGLNSVSPQVERDSPLSISLVFFQYCSCRSATADDERHTIILQILPTTFLSRNLLARRSRREAEETFKLFEM